MSARADRRTDSARRVLPRGSAPLRSNPIPGMRGACEIAVVATASAPWLTQGLRRPALPLSRWHRAQRAAPMHAPTRLEGTAMLREIIETHLRARRAGRRCPDSDWLHRMMLDRGCSCPCKTPHSRAVVAVEQPAAPGGDWYPANPPHNDDHPTCCICMTSMDPAGARRLPCSHAFHPECLARCLQHSALCPLCKVPVE